MKIQLTRNTVVNGQPQAIGDVIEVNDQDGKFLINIKKAVRFIEPDAQVVEAPAQNAEIETADAKPALETADRKPRGKRKE